MTKPSIPGSHLQWVIGATPTTEFVSFDHETLFVRFASGETQTIDLFEDMEDESECAA